MASVITIFFVMLASTFIDLLPLLSALLGGGILGGIVTMLKAGAERESIAAQASKTAIEVFESSIARLSKDLEAAHTLAAHLTRELTAARTQVGEIAAERSELQTEVVALRTRLTELEAIVERRKHST